MRVLCLTHGTDGDVHPLVGLGLALRQRGHLVTMMLNSHFEPLVRRHGFEFVSMGEASEYQAMLDLPGIYHPVKSIFILGRFVTEPMRRQFEFLADSYRPGETVVLASGAAFGARIAHEKLGVPLATVVLQPAMVRSEIAPPVVAGMPPMPRWTPHLVKSLALTVVDFVGDRLFQRKTVNAFRGELGLPPVKRMLRDWWLSPQLVLGLFPAWFAAPQPDWPKQLHLTGFPMFDEASKEQELPDDLRRVLDAGPPPLVFTPGTGVKHRPWFFEAAAAAAAGLKRPAIFLTRYPEQLPQPLPAHAHYFPYVPFSRMLPRCGAIIHSGGIGTCAQAFAAGIPQLIVPMAYDQPDNAHRIRTMGTGDFLLPKHFRCQAVTVKLRQLLNSREVAQRCQDLASRRSEPNPVTQSCELIESLIHRA